MNAAITPGRETPPTEGGRAIRILIVDDHVLFAEMLQSALEAQGIEVLGIATDGKQASRMARSLRPDLVLMDVGLPDMGGLEAGRAILAESPETKLVAVTGLNDPGVVREAIRDGFQGYIIKDASIAELVGSVMAVSRNQTVIPQHAAQTLAGMPANATDAVGLARQLTSRERQVLALLVEGEGSQQLAERLFLSRNTIRTHVQNICSKLQVHSRLEAVAFAVKYGIVDMERSGQAGSSAGGSSSRRPNENPEPASVRR
jgi:DNA-binding NarL/FixJ family response regulator